MLNCSNQTYTWREDGKRKRKPEIGAYRAFNKYKGIQKEAKFWLSLILYIYNTGIHRRKAVNTNGKGYESYWSKVAGDTQVFRLSIEWKDHGKTAVIILNRYKHEDQEYDGEGSLCDGTGKPVHPHDGEEREEYHDDFKKY
jgi:hypothetical protein